MVIVAIFWIPAAAAAQQGTLLGTVVSSDTRSPLEGVDILLEIDGRTAHNASTDRNGFFQVGGIGPGTYTLRARLIGHGEHTQQVSFVATDRLRVSLSLTPDPVVLQSILVSPQRGTAVRDLGRQRITPADIRLVPTPGGSGDLATYLQTLPGVATTGDRGGQVFVRGGTPAENLALVDGIPIYQPFHILGFFSVFPASLVSGVDYYAGGFGARYHDRTSSVLDVRLRDGDPNRQQVLASVSPFLAEVLVEGPVKPGVSWLASARRSLVEETSGTLLGDTQPLTFESQLLKFTTAEGPERRCSALALRTSDRGRLDREDTESRVAWRNLIVGGRCVFQGSGVLPVIEVNFSYTSADNTAVSRGLSKFRSSIWRMQNDVHVTGMIGSVPFHAGYQTYFEITEHDLAELFSIQAGNGDVFGIAAYLEADLIPGDHLQARPGLVFSASPHGGVQPRLRASWEPFGRPSEKLQGAVGLYRQDVIGTSDMRDVGSVFTAWMRPQDGHPLEALHVMAGWQQSVGDGLQWSLEGYYKQLDHIPVPVWRGVVQFTTDLGQASGRVYGADTRIEYTRPHFRGFIGYGYAWTRYEQSQANFASWFGEPVQRYHPPHDRRHQLNALASFDTGPYRASARWQFGSGLPFTRPLGFDEAVDFSQDVYDMRETMGTTRIVLDKPFTRRMPAMHRLDLSVQRDFDLPIGKLEAQGGVINAYARRNMFYYDLYTARRVDQLPFAPYLSVTLRGN